MNESQLTHQQIYNTQSSSDLTSSPIRNQLLWSTLFPLVLFGLLSILVINTAFYEFSLRLVTQRNTAQAQVIADHLAQNLTRGMTPAALDLDKELQLIGTTKAITLYMVTSDGTIINRSEEAPLENFSTIREFAQIIRNPDPASRLLQSPTTNDEVIISAAAISGTAYKVILVDPWAAIMAPAANYQILLVGLAILGILLSLFMLSLAISRIIKPINVLVENATQAVPGSIFHPIRENGPQEIRTLINAFNKMVIRLAEQQSDLRNYAHKALLSQEEERQRLSHELHDCTLQDLVGLSQRVELCRNELVINPENARDRLDEIHTLLERTMEDVRNISIALRPPVLEDLGLVVALGALCKEMNQDKTGLQCDFSVEGEPCPLASDLELAVYRVVQEALTNIRKHVPDVTQVKVEVIFHENEIITNIINDGTPFFSANIQDYVRTGHIGLAGMYERARLFGGLLNITTNQNGHTVITLQLPYDSDSGSV